jgi:phage terminase Nu1 subunit (DNA packaging protein)
MNNKITVTQAAEILGRGERTVKHYATKGLLTRHKAPGKTNPMTVYDEEEVKALKKQMDDELDAAAESQEAAKQESKPFQLARRQTVEAAMTNRADDMARFITLLAANVAEHLQTPRSTPLSDKLMLSLPEAAEVSGISVAKLRAAVKAGELKTIKSIGGGLGKVKSIDLLGYVTTLK